MDCKDLTIKFITLLGFDPVTQQAGKQQLWHSLILSEVI